MACNCHVDATPLSVAVLDGHKSSATAVVVQNMNDDPDPDFYENNICRVKQ